MYKISLQTNLTSFGYTLRVFFVVAVFEMSVSWLLPTTSRIDYNKCKTQTKSFVTYKHLLNKHSLRQAENVSYNLFCKPDNIPVVNSFSSSNGHLEWKVYLRLMWQCSGGRTLFPPDPMTRRGTIWSSSPRSISNASFLTSLTRF